MNIDNPLLKKTESLNPYRRAASLILNRIKWDVTRESWRSRSKLREVKDQHLGDKAVILCNGPSLLNVDFELLKKSGVYTFGLNKINLLFDKTLFRPSCIVSVNSFVIEQNRNFFNDTEIPLFLDSEARNLGVYSRKNVAMLHSTNMRGEFARDCSYSIFQGHTVTYVAMQLAFHMGFKEVALVGCDHNFDTKGPANKTIISEGRDPNHFDPNYFSGGMKWQLPDLFESEIAYKIAGDVYEASGRKLINATTGGELNIFKRMSLDEFIKSE